MFRMAKLRTSCKFTKGVSGRFVVTNKWHYWVQSALHGIRLYAQSGSDEIDQKWNDQIPSKEVTRSGKALIDRFSSAILPDFGKFCHFGEILKSLAKAIEWVILCLAKVWTYFGNFFYNWAYFVSSKYPNIDQNIRPSGHTELPGLYFIYLFSVFFNQCNNLTTNRCENAGIQTHNLSVVSLL